MSPTMIALGPSQDSLLIEAIEQGGATPADVADAQALVWAAGPADFPDPVPDNIEWVQLFSAGVEEFFTSGVIPRYPNVRFTSAAGAFAHTVAEHALALLLAGVRYLPEQLGARTWRSNEFAPHVGTLRGATVGIVGAGSIGRALIPMLAAIGARVVAVNRSGTPVPGAAQTIPAANIGEIWSRIDHVVVAAPATPATAHLVGEAELAQLKPTSWVINVARGSLVDTDALVTALRSGTIGGVGLDVTDPEPLPDGHPLWALPNAMITPHDSNPPQRRDAAFADRVATNVRRFVAGQDLVAPIDPISGY